MTMMRVKCFAKLVELARFIREKAETTDLETLTAYTDLANVEEIAERLDVSIRTAYDYKYALLEILRALK